MAGHSKWSKVKHIKGPLDQKRGQLFSKLAKEITVAPSMGGGVPADNPRLRSAILASRAQSMANDNIERAIKRGTGAGAEAFYIEESVCEAYAPGGVALTVKAATDNRNRTAAMRAVADPAVPVPVVQLIDVLEDTVDVQHEHTNFSPTGEALAELSA